VPPDLDWYVWRVVRAGYGKPHEINDAWTLAQLESAHMTLDIHEDLERMAARGSAS
jgi:hypothetical protein